MKVFRVTLKLRFDIDATSGEVAIEKAQTELTEWLENVETIRKEDIEVEELAK